MLTRSEINCESVVGALVESLGDDYAVIPKLSDRDGRGSHYFSFKNVKTGVQFYVSSQHGHGKLAMGVALPPSWSFGRVVYKGNDIMEIPRIMMDAEKQMIKIVRDFRNRLEKDGTDYWNLAQEIVNKQNQHKDKTLATKEAIAKIRGIPLSSHERIDGKSISINPANIGYYGDVEISGDHCTLKLSSLTPSQLERVLKALYYISP